MSKISQELKTLLYLNQRRARNDFIPVSEIAEHLEVSTRQARRYLEDLSNIIELGIEVKLGRDGGYRLGNQLDQGLVVAENIVLAMSIAMKRNENVEKVLCELPNYVVTDFIEGDNRIDDETLDKLQTIIQAIIDHKELSFHYLDIPKTYVIQPYRIFLTNHAYYLFSTHDETIKKFNVSNMREINRLASFKPKKAVLDEILSRFSRYGIKDGEKTLLRVRCQDEEALKTFHKYYEGKGVMNIDNLAYEVTGNSENELYYPLFRISTKIYRFLDEDFKEGYLRYLHSIIKSIERR